MPGGKRRHEDDFNNVFAGTFVFRDPEDVFREFFGGTPIEDLFGGNLLNYNKFFNLRYRNAFQFRDFWCFVNFKSS